MQRNGRKKKLETAIQRRIVRLKVCYQLRDLRYGDRVWRNSVTNIIGTNNRPAKGLNRSLCVYGERYGFRGVRVAISGSDGSQARVRLRNEGAIRDLRVLGSDPSDTAI